MAKRAKPAPAAAPPYPYDAPEFTDRGADMHFAAGHAVPPSPTGRYGQVDYSPGTLLQTAVSTSPSVAKAITPLGAQLLGQLPGRGYVRNPAQLQGADVPQPTVKIERR